MAIAGSSSAKRRRGRKGSDKIESAVLNQTASYSPHKILLIQLTDEEPRWYNCAQHIPERNQTVKSNPPAGSQRNTKELVEKYRSLADSIYQNEVQLFTNSREKTSDDKWVETTIKRGTLKDRIAAMSVVVSTDPVHKLHAMDGLLQMAGCSESGHQQTNSRVAHLAAEALTDLFQSTYLPANRKLITLHQRPLYLFEAGASDQDGGKKKSTKQISPRILLLWRFEEILRDKYQLFLRQYLGFTLREGMELEKNNAIRTTASLLRSVPEGEASLLQMLVNKLGDPGKKVAASAGMELRKTLLQHPAMQEIIAREVQQLAHRPKLSSKALYNCMVFLNQLKLSREDELVEQGGTPLAASLVTTYFRLFEVAVKKPAQKEDKNAEESGMRSRLLSALLTGVNRAHPYLPEKNQKMEEHIDALYRVVHASSPAATTQALLLLFHLAVGSKLETSIDKRREDGPEDKARSERFYRALYSCLSRDDLLGSGKHLTMIFNLLYKAMKHDTESTRVLAFAKRLMCTTVHCSPPILSATLFLLSEIAKQHRIVLSCFQDVIEGEDALRVLDPSKREPRGALTVKGNEGKKEDILEKIQAPSWELSLAAHHYHPTVQTFVGTMGKIAYTGDPLKDFSLAPFLDKFAYRNPKSAKRVAGKFQRGESIAERRSGTDQTIQSHFSLPFNDPSFVDRSDIANEDEFFHRFFVERSRRDKLKGVVRSKPTDEDEAELEDAEIKVLDDIEKKDMDQDATHAFDDYERQWESDSDEEAFVDSLAEKIIEDAIEDYKPGDLDDEDPDMEGWSDLENSDEEESAQVDQEDDFSVVDFEDDAESDGVGDSVDGEIGVEKDMDDFMDDSDDESSGSQPQSPGFESESESDGDINEANESGSEDDLLFLDEESSVEERKGKKRKVKEQEFSSTFADADVYAKKIESSWKKLKRKEVSEREEELPENTRIISQDKTSSSKKKKYKKGKH